MVLIEPDPRKVGEAAVLSNLPCGQVTVEIDDRQIAGEAVVEFDRPIVLQKEVFLDEVVHAHALCGNSSPQRRIGRGKRGERGDHCGRVDRVGQEPDPCPATKDYALLQRFCPKEAVE